MEVVCSSETSVNMYRTWLLRRQHTSLLLVLVNCSMVLNTSARLEVFWPLVLQHDCQGESFVAPDWEGWVSETTANLSLRPCLEVNSRSATQELSRLLWNPTVYYGVTRLRHWTLFWASWIQSTYSHRISQIYWCNIRWEFNGKSHFSHKLPYY
jgi:hypothetical protein